MNNLIASLVELLDPSTVLTGADISEKYHADWSGADPCQPLALLKPKTTQQLSEIMALCHQHDQPVVIQGGLTGLAGGATPQSGEIAISLERMNGIEELDASLVKEMGGGSWLVRADTLPLMFSVMGGQNLPRGARVRVKLADIDLMALDVRGTVTAHLDAEGQVAEAEEAEDEEDLPAGPVTIAVDMNDSPQEPSV